MASSSARVFTQTFRFARNLKSSASKVQKITGSLHVPSINSRRLSQAQLARPLASAYGLLNGQANLSFKTKIQFAPQQENCGMLIRSAGFLSPAVEASEDCSASCSEGSDSSCEAMEGPHGDDDGLVIHGTSLEDDL